MAFSGPVRCMPPATASSIVSEDPIRATVISKDVSEIVNNMLTITDAMIAPENDRSCRIQKQASFRSSVEFAKTKPELYAMSKQILMENDRGGYTIPAKGLYPYQWNWDSALVALGLASLDEKRAWEELDKLMSAQWEDGMVPHIVFHKASSSYFPGPEIWGSVEKPLGTTGITQPPVAAITIRKLYENAIDKAFAIEKVETLFPRLLAWHEWFYVARDPEGTGLVATLHPWETGMDNSPAWDEALARVPVDDIPPYVRRDLGHVDSKMRPNQGDYDRYLTLLYRFKALNYDLDKLYFTSPFRVTDLCTNCILHRANVDLLWLANEIGKENQVKNKISKWIECGRKAFGSLYDDKAGMYRSKDQITGKLVVALTSAGFLPLFAGVAGAEEAARVTLTLEGWLERVKYGVPSSDPTPCPSKAAAFEALRYWRGPVWLIVNWMITEGLRNYGYESLASRIEGDSYQLLKNGLYEYYCPLTGVGAGGSFFSWTAAMCLAWIIKS